MIFFTCFLGGSSQESHRAKEQICYFNDSVLVQMPFPATIYSNLLDTHAYLVCALKRFSEQVFNKEFQ